MIEYIDIYNSDRKPTGEIVERGTALKAGQFQMYVTAIVRDRAGRFLITRRALDKSWGAGWWEVTGGGLRAGETIDEGLAREVSEEVGLSIQNADVRLIHSYENIDSERGDNYFMNIFLIDMDFTLDDVTLQAEEAIDCRLVTWEEIDALNREGIFLHFKRIAAALENC